ncbi:oxidoreductase [Ornatilinea apprima]|uniref:Oxidoreductase n=1 Tax=Ornatilinea apprima TaxID=1134406 RepID=A0A0P6XQ13_9CHLR|nr:Gfo/Idh/MocA family oxidoreductase [Ornatilinea apprima]KPL77340.1 oxidoreductase [Ornatilinea apprima]
MKSEKITVGVIGVGQIGKLHLETYLSMPNVRVVGIAGRDPQRTEAVARQYNIPFWTTNYHALLENPNIQAVSVCLHNNLHMPVSVAALRAGKHVFCEKPIAGSYHDGLIMLETAAQQNRLLSIQLSDLFSKETKAAKVAIENGWLGAPYLAHSSGFRRRGRPFVDGYGSSDFVKKEIAGGGALYDLGVYHIANILYLLGNPRPLRMSGRTFQQTEMHQGRKNASHFNVEELAVGLVNLENNIALSVIEAWAMHLDHLESSYITGTMGGIRLNPFGLFRSLGDLDLNTTADLDSFDFRSKNVQETGDCFDGPQQHFIAAVEERIQPIPTAEIALNTMLILEGIYLSEHLGCEVTADLVKSNSQGNAIPA